MLSAFLDELVRSGLTRQQFNCQKKYKAHYLHFLYQNQGLIFVYQGVYGSQDFGTASYDAPFCNVRLFSLLAIITAESMPIITINGIHLI